MGGHISVSSEPEGPTCFTVTLPLQEGWMETEDRTQDLVYHPPAPHHTHVLLAGPLQHPHGLQQLPETMGCRVTRAADGNELLAMVSNDIPDVIILDSHLGVAEATEVLHRLKRNTVLKAIPVLVTSTAEQPTQLETEADGIIGDTFNYRQMYQVLSPFVQTTQQQYPVSSS